jgi:hypothetical protein
MATVKVLEKPHPKSAVIETIGLGVQLEAVQRKGLFWEVRTPAGASGFVMMTMVSEGSQQVGLKLQGAMRSLLKEKRGQDDGSEGARSRSKNAVMGIRGLNNGDLSQVGNLRPNYRALEQLEALEVDAQSVERLAREVMDEAARRTGS